jgi:hypothetical protein
LQSWFPTPRANAEQWYANWSALRVRTLFSVDDGLKSLIDTIGAREAGSTIFVLTSDNGWFSVSTASTAGSGSPRGRTSGDVDRRARIRTTAGRQRIRHEPRSRSHVHRASGAKPVWRSTGAIQELLSEHDLGRDRYFPIYIPTEPGDAKRQPTGTGVRTWRYKYVRYHDGSEELYDLATDPYELTNLATAPQWNEVKVGMKRLMEEGRRCHGTSCRASAPPLLR